MGNRSAWVTAVTERFMRVLAHQGLAGNRSR
jgi:hypothetical protein